MAIFDVHHPWVFTFGVLGNIVSISVYFAPLPTFIQICKRKSTSGFQCLPYVVALFSAMLWLYYASLKTSATLLMTINAFGCVIETIYIALFLVYATKEAKRHTVKLIASLIAGFSAIFFLTYFILPGPNRAVVVGWICVAISVSVFAAPLSIVFQVIRTQSVEFMPVTLSFFLTLTAIMWFAYGMLQKDLCIALPNVFGFFLGLFQMLLYGMYKNPKEVEVMDERNSKEMVVMDERKLQEHIINMGILGNSEVCLVRDDKISGGNENSDEDDKERDQTDDNEKSVAMVPSSPEQNNHMDVQLQLQSPPPVFVVCAA